MNKLEVTEVDMDPKPQLSRPETWKQIVFSTAMCMLDFSFGACIGFTGIVLPSITDPNSEDYMNYRQVSFYTSAFFIGGMIGSIISGPLINKCGHRRGVILSMPLFIFGWSISYFSHTYWVHLISRISIGMYGYICLGLSSTFIAEIAHTSLRGRLIAFTDLGRQTGYLYVFLIGSSGLDWRTTGMLCLLPSMIPFIAMIFAQNSPRWLAVRGHSDDEVMKSLRFYRGKEYNVQIEFDQIKNDVMQSNIKPSIVHQLRLLKTKPINKLIGINVLLNFLFPFTGTIVILSYSITIFQAATLSISPYLSTIICGLLRVISCSLYILLADHFGRKSMSVVFLALNGLSSLGLGCYFYLDKFHVDVSTVFWLPLTLILVMTFSSCLWVPVLMTFRSELMPNSVRSLGFNIMTLMLGMASLITTFVFPFIVEHIGNEWIFIAGSITAFIMATIIWIFLPETKGKSLEEIAMFK